MYHADGQYDRATPRSMDTWMRLKFGTTKIHNTEWLIFGACPFCTEIPWARGMASDVGIMSCFAGLKMWQAAGTGDPADHGDHHAALVVPIAMASGDGVDLESLLGALDEADSFLKSREEPWRILGSWEPVGPCPIGVPGYPQNVSNSLGMSRKLCSQLKF